MAQTWKDIENADRAAKEKKRRKKVNNALRDVPAPGAAFVRPFEKVAKGLAGVNAGMTKKK